MKHIFGLDPGTEKSAIVYLKVSDIELTIQDKKIFPNWEMKRYLFEQSKLNDSLLLIENIQSFGMAVGQSVFETAIWIGRFYETWQMYNAFSFLIYRKNIKQYFCNSIRAKDANIRQALIDRFGEPGTKGDPQFTYGLKSDLWSAFAIAVFMADQYHFFEKQLKKDGNLNVFDFIQISKKPVKFQTTYMKSDYQLEQLKQKRKEKHNG